MSIRALKPIDFLLPSLVGLVGLLLLLTEPGSLYRLRNNLFDQYQRGAPRVYEAAPVRIIDIDEESLARHGQWPWPRPLLAQLVDALNAAGAAAIMPMPVLPLTISARAPIPAVSTICPAV